MTRPRDGVVDTRGRIFDIAIARPFLWATCRVCHRVAHSAVVLAVEDDLTRERYLEGLGTVAGDDVDGHRCDSAAGQVVT